MSTPAEQVMATEMPAFTQGIRHFAEDAGEPDSAIQTAVIDESESAISEINDVSVYQTQLAADALRYLTLQVCSSKESGHPGGFASSAFAVTGDMILLPVFEAKNALEEQGYKVRIVSVTNPRRLYRPDDVAWNTVSEADGTFMSDADFDALFDADIMIGVSDGASGSLESVMLRSRAARRDVMCWKRGETTASPQEIMQFNGLSSDAIITRINKLAGG